ncbi:serine protease gd-like isoform X2 [Pararge aegeria]|uniref:serine protease gd-like isoform X2 n=1 Tax=Pararge aegeria TaxID=116150 RepID=UPI0019D2E324|nr:serine protease gd-like isoform X2 [Pararge aegeria]
MKLNLSLVKMIIKLLILLILIVMLGIISACLYSIKYWPDVYNYINGNITIKRIPKISEIENYTIVEGTTDTYRTTSAYEIEDTTTTSGFETNYFDLDDVESSRKKRNIEIEVPKDYSEVPKSIGLVEYFFDLGDSTTETLNDSVNEEKLTTRSTKDVEIISGTFSTPKYLRDVDVTSKCSNYTKNATEAIFPWIAAIFIKNDTSDQFDYYCDGALLSETMVITSARCMEYYGSEMDAKNLLVLLGKSSLQSMSGAERAVKVNSVIIHENFTTTEGNDIAILFLERVALNEHIQTVCLGGEKGLEAATTGWAISGELTIIPFVTDQSFKCKVSKGNYTFCAAYGNDVTICPSYGGVYAVKDLNGWYLQGIRSGDPSNRGLCFDRSVYFTDLTNYVEWIDKNSK